MLSTAFPRALVVTIPALLHVLLALLVFMLATKNLYDAFAVTLLPGDSYTYEVLLYTVLDRANEHYWATLVSMFVGGSPHNASAIPILVALFSPLLVKEPSSLVLVNFVAILAAILLLVRLLSRIGVEARVAALVPALVWLLPFSYTRGVDTTSLLSLMPDTVFLWMMCSAAILTIVYLTWPHRRGYALASALAIGLSVWARGNSSLYVGLLVALAGVGLVVSIAWNRPWDRTAAANFVLWLATIASLSAFYVYNHYERIADYYGRIYAFNAPAYTTERALTGALWIVGNVPGAYFAYARDSLVTHVLSFAFHTYFLWLLVHATRRLRAAATDRGRLVAIALLLSAVYYLTGLLLGGASLAPIYSWPVFRVFGPFAPILLGVVISFAVFLALAVDRLGWITARNTAFVAAVLAAIIAVTSATLSRRYLLPQSFVEQPSTRMYTEDYRNFALALPELTRGRPVAFLWYGDLSAPGVDYYDRRVSRFSPRIATRIDVVDTSSLYRTGLDARLIASADEFRSSLRTVLGEADFIVIAERLDDYELEPTLEEPRVRQRSAGLFGVYSREFADVINDPRGPSYLIRAIVQGRPGHRVFLLEKLFGMPPPGVPVFERDWGTPHQRVGREFPGVPVFGYVAKTTAPLTLYRPLRDASFDSFVELHSAARTMTLRAYADVFVDSYEIASGSHQPESVDRAPLHWQVFGSTDGTRWQLIDHRRLTERWQASQARSFSIPRAGPFTALRVRLIDAEAGGACCRLYELHFADRGVRLDRMFASTLEVTP